MRVPLGRAPPSAEAAGKLGGGGTEHRPVGGRAAGDGAGLGCGLARQESIYQFTGLRSGPTT
jgi:hypothetical protein